MSLIVFIIMTHRKAFCSLTLPAQVLFSQQFTEQDEVFPNTMTGSMQVANCDYSVRSVDNASATILTGHSRQSSRRDSEAFL